MHKKQVKTGGNVDSILNSTAVSLIGAGDLVIHYPTDFVFEELSRMKSSALTNTTIKQWAKAAGIDKCVSWHTARRTFGTLLVEGGADAFTASKLMGHTSLSMTDRYVDVAETKQGRSRHLTNWRRLILGRQARGEHDKTCKKYLPLGATLAFPTTHYSRYSL